MKNYCITVSMQKISSIHWFIQQILGTHELTRPIFDQAHPKIIEIAFSFLKFAPASKNQTIPSLNNSEQDFKKLFISKFHLNSFFLKSVIEKEVISVINEMKTYKSTVPKSMPLEISKSDHRQTPTLPN